MRETSTEKRVFTYHNMEKPIDNNLTSDRRAAELSSINAELARRELAKRNYADYLPYVHQDWKQTRMSGYIADRIQQFVESSSDNAYDILVIETPPQHGKLCSDDTMVPTPDGWKRHGDLHSGDYVFGPDGKPKRVLAEILQTEPASLQVTFSDGARVKVHPNHEWVVSDRRSSDRRKAHTYETHVMMEKGLHIGKRGRGGRYVYAVDANTVIDYPEQELPVHPYFLGLWLGDGSTVKPCITHHPDDTESIEKVVGLGYPISAVCKHKETGVLTTYFHGMGYDALRRLDFAHSHGTVKHIPDVYKRSSVSQRLELLAGMIDSDGYVYPCNGRVTISNINKRLIDDFAEVVRSLGWRACVSRIEPHVSTSGIKGVHAVYQLTFSPDMAIPTALPRKRTERIRPKKRRRAIVDISPCEPVHGKCITVEGGIYLITDHFIPTHNSMTVTETLPSWYLGRHPRARVIVAGYNDEFAERFCRRNKEKVKSFGAVLFGQTVGQIDRATEFELGNKVGRLISRGIRSGITGNPANLVIIDDPVKNREEADSETFRNKVWEEWQNSIKSRLSAGAKVIVIMTPWHEDDLAARILASETNSTLLRLPVEAEEDDPLGRSPGEALCPELGKGDRWLADFKQSYINDPLGGARAWAALYMCSPRVEGGNLVQRSWWRYYNPQDITSFGTMLISVDATFKNTEKSDDVAITVWGKRWNDYYCLYCNAAKRSFTETLYAIRMIKQLYPAANRVLIEDKANGSAIIDVLQREFFCIPVNPRGGKESRVQAVAPAIEAGHVYLPLGQGWTEALVDQFSAFPAGAHDDIVDSTTQALSYMIFSSGLTAADLPALPADAQYAQQEQERFLDGSVMYDVYGEREQFVN